MSRLIEFHNHKGELLRGILDEAPETDRAVVFVHGFERTTIESKFKRIVDTMRGSATLFRFDFSGCGLSEGSFEDVSVAKLTRELGCALEELCSQAPWVKRISFVSHSLGGCITLLYATQFQDATLDRMVFLAPAWNQKKLLRYFFAVRSLTKEQKKTTTITWQDYQSYFNEEAYQKDCAVNRRMLKEHYLGSEYFAENMDRDYQDYLEGFDMQRALLIHGDRDDKVPFESLDRLPDILHVIHVAKGDHDLQRPDMVEQYLSLVVDFLR